MGTWQTERAVHEYGKTLRPERNGLTFAVDIIAAHTKDMLFINVNQSQDGGPTGAAPMLSLVSLLASYSIYMAPNIKAAMFINATQKCLLEFAYTETRRINCLSEILPVMIFINSSWKIIYPTLGGCRSSRMSLRYNAAV